VKLVDNNLVENAYCERIHDDILTQLDPLTTIDLLWKTLDELENGAGLSAVQIGIFQRISVYEWNGVRKVIMNAHYIPMGVRQKDFEGCLSYPNRDSIIIKRPKVIRAFYDTVDENNQIVRGVVEKLKGFEARIFQHETDHQNGKTIYM